MFIIVKCQQLLVLQKRRIHLCHDIRAAITKSAHSSEEADSLEKDWTAYRLLPQYLATISSTYGSDSVAVASAVVRINILCVSTISASFLYCPLLFSPTLPYLPLLCPIISRPVMSFPVLFWSTWYNPILAFYHPVKSCTDANTH